MRKSKGEKKMNECFNKYAFMSWLKEEFPGVIDTHWNHDLVTNVIDYALKHKNISKDQLAYFISDLLPEIEFLEVAKFCSNECLTGGTLEQLGRYKKESHFDEKRFFNKDYIFNEYIHRSTEG